MKNRVIKYCQDNNIEVEIQKDYDDKRKIECISFYTPEGYCFEEDLHCRVFGDLYYYKIKDVWEQIYEELIFHKLKICPTDCACKE